jgi:hypothetical protein
VLLLAKQLGNNRLFLEVTTLHTRTGMTIRKEIFLTEHLSPYLDHLHYWGDGNLYVFFEPTAKTACLFIQSS